jgi:hypothetical protein
MKMLYFLHLSRLTATTMKMEVLARVFTKPASASFILIRNLLEIPSQDLKVLINQYCRAGDGAGAAAFRVMEPGPHQNV